MVQRLSMSPSYFAVLHGLFEMYRLAKEGKFDSPEADAIRDEMDAPWTMLTETEKHTARDLSAALNAIVEDGGSR